MSSTKIQQAATMLSTATYDLRLSAAAPEVRLAKRNARSSNPTGLTRGSRQGFLDFAPPPAAKHTIPDNKSMRYSRDHAKNWTDVCHRDTPIIRRGLSPLII